jgi:hypothetical protein
MGNAFLSPTNTCPIFSCFSSSIPSFKTNNIFKRMDYSFLVFELSPLISKTIQHVYIKMRSTARPTAEMETRVPMQYFITSYFAASNWALKAWISWYYTINIKSETITKMLINQAQIILIKFIEPYSSTKDTLREEVCSRLIKFTTQVYLGNVRLLTLPLTCGTIVQTREQRKGMSNIVQGPEALIP